MAVRGKGALHDVDQLSIFKSVTKSSRRLTEPDELANDVTTAISECRSGRPGPVFLEIPFDVLISGAKRRGRAREAATKKKVDPKSLAVTSRMLERAERPVIIIGGGVNTSRSWGEVAKLANILEIPVASTISAKGAFPEDPSLSIGDSFGTESPGKPLRRRTWCLRWVVASRKGRPQTGGFGSTAA
jgi:acetolactate synthase I/II/III large subunit